MMGAKLVLARLIYDVTMRLSVPLYVAKLWRLGASEPLYRHRLRERFALYTRTLRPQPEAWPVVWVHAVSLGETRAAKPLIEGLRQRHPAMRLVLTCSTATGMQAGHELLGAGDVQTWLPMDIPGAVRRFFRRARPTVGVVMDTEVWPNLMRVAARKKVPMILANGRLSQSSLDHSNRFATLLGPAVAAFDAVLAQSVTDAQRLRQAGARHVVVCGNLKFDVTPPPKLTAKGLSWRTALRRPVVLMAASREGEEAMLLDAWAGVASPKPLLVIVPRRAQRLDEVASQVEGRGLRLLRRSRIVESPSPDDANVDVWLGDSVGEMALYFACADVALLGSSFGVHGGQNLIEAAACGCPVVMGLHTYNVAETTELALQARAALRVADMQAGVTQAVILARDVQRNAWVERALRFAAEHRGATERMVQRIDTVIQARRAP
jgi:3-deoxy-D-manno-octulosonic-acid transferase